VDGIRIVRAGQSVFGKRGLATRAFDFISFYLAALWRVIWLPRQDIVVCFTTPPFIALVGILLRWVKGTKVVCWTMDLYPDVPVAAGVLRRGSMAHTLFDAVDRFALRHADRVVALGRCMQQRLLDKGVDPARLEVINVWADGDEVRERAPEDNALRAAWNVGDRFVIEYSGNFGIGHDGDTMYRAMQTTRGDDSIRWVIVGGGTKREELESFVRDHDIVNAVLKPYQPREALGELLSLGNVHLVCIAENFSGLLVPSKFYGVLAAGRPVLYVGPRHSEVARVIEESRCGMVVPQGDSDGLVSAIQRLHGDRAQAQSMGHRAREAFERHYTRAKACARWLQLLQRL
jgi:glycosyltransferase involved in cell wall biosynthesis